MDKREKEVEATIHLFDNSDNLHSFAAGTTLFKAGEARKYLYVVVEGEVDLFINNTHVETVCSGGIFGEMALIDQDVRVATAVTRTDCKLALVDENQFSFLIQQTPYFALTVMRILAQRLRKMNAHLT